MTSTENSASAHLPRKGNWLQRIFTAFGRAHARRIAMRELYALDNRLLQDIGLRRDEVGTTVSAMFRTLPVVAPAKPSREVPASGPSAVGARNDSQLQSAA